MNINRFTAYHIYSLKSGYKAVFFNTKTRKYIFLDGLSAELFRLLLYKSNKLYEWCQKNKLCSNDVSDFIDQLISLGIVDSIKPQTNLLESNTYYKNTEDSTQASALNDFIEELYENGLFYSLHIDLTNHCNEKCIHCYHPFDQYDYSDEMSTDTVKKLIDDAYDCGVFTIVLSGGEAILRKDFFEIIEYISNKGMSITLFTNGVLLNEENVRHLSKYRISVVSISIYGDNATLHDSITRIKGSFEKTLNGIEQLKHFGIEFDLKCVMLAENIDRIEEISEFCKMLNFGRECTLDFTLCGKINGDCSVFEHRITNEKLKDVFFSNPEKFIGKRENFSRTPESISCGAGRHGLYCSADGKLYPCVSFRLLLGDCKDFKNIGESMTLKQWQQSQIKDFNGCFSHPYCKFCLEQCAGNNLIENGDWHCGETSHCDRAKIISEWFTQTNQGGEING